MALRLRKDVQKASYYVWFLGAEESRGLRGTRILHSAIPYLVDRSREIEPIKVTLQVSHKGMKIIQVSLYALRALLTLSSAIDSSTSLLSHHQRPPFYRFSSHSLGFRLVCTRCFAFMSTNFEQIVCTN